MTAPSACDKMAPVTTGAISFEGFVGAAESVMRRAFSRAELGGSAEWGKANEAKVREFQEWSHAWTWSAGK